MSQSPGSDPIAAEIEAEIADHLATAAEKLQSQGLSIEKAHEKSKVKFGDPQTIGRRCYWIKQGDALMFRTATIVLLTLLCFTLGLVAYGSYRTQRQMAEEMSALAKQLQAIAERQQSAGTPSAIPESRPPEITGNVYFASPDHPTANSEVLICRASDGEIVRRVSTDSAGKFQSGPLADGDYTLTAKGVTDPRGRSIGAQIGPLYVYSGMPNINTHIDATYHAGQFAVELSRPLPQLEVDGKYKLESRLYIAALTTQLQSTRWTAANPIPGRWPIYIMLPESQPQLPDRGFVGPYTVLSNADLEASLGKVVLSVNHDLPIGPCSLVAAIFSDVLPANNVVVSQLPSIADSRRDKEYVVDWMSKNYVLQTPMGQAWLNTLTGSEKLLTSLSRWGGGGFGPTLGPSELFQNHELVARVNIEDGTTTRLRIEVPADLESRIADLLDTVTKPLAFVQSVNTSSPFIRQAKIDILPAE